MLCDRSNIQHFCNADKLNNMFSFYYSWQRSLELMRNYEDEHDFLYDFVLVARFDMAFKARVDASEAIAALSRGTQLFGEPTALASFDPLEYGYTPHREEGVRVRQFWFDSVLAGSSEAVYKCSQGFNYLTDPHRLFAYPTFSSHLTVPYTCAAEGILCENPGEEAGWHGILFKEADAHAGKCSSDDESVRECGRLHNYVTNVPLIPARGW